MHRAQFAGIISGSGEAYTVDFTAKTQEQAERIIACLWLCKELPTKAIEGLSEGNFKMSFTQR